METLLLPNEILYDDRMVPIAFYLESKASNFTLRHPERKGGISVDEVREMLTICTEGRDAPVETERWWDSLLEEVCNDLYNTQQFMSKETKIVTLQTVNEYQEIVEAARTTTMAHGFNELLAKYDFGVDFTEINPRNGSEPTPRDLAACCGLGMSLGNSGQNLIAAAVAQLLAQGEKMSDVVEQIGATLKLKYSTLSNYNRTYLRTPAEYKTLPFDVQKEIATSVYDSDPEKDQQIREELFERADKEGWTSSEARSARKAAQGHDAPIIAETPEQAMARPRYYYGKPGEAAKFSKECPVFTDDLWCVDVKDRTYLALEGNKFVFLPMEKAKAE